MASSRTARRKRRQAAALRRFKRLCREGRLPVHTRAERKREAEERQRQREAERRRTRRNRKFAAVAGTPTVAAAIITFAPPVHISLHEIYGPYVVAEATSWPDKPDYPHTELLEVAQPDPFIPAVGTASPFASYGPYPSGGVTSHPDGWERYRWLMHDD